MALGPSCTPGNPATCQDGVHRLARLCRLASQRDTHATHPETTVGSSLCHQGPSRGHGHLKYAKNGSRNMCLPAFHVRGRGGDRSLRLGKASPIPRCPGWALSLTLCMPPLRAPVPELHPFPLPRGGQGAPKGCLGITREVLGEHRLLGVFSAVLMERVWGRAQECAFLRSSGRILVSGQAGVRAGKVTAGPHSMCHLYRDS